MQVHEHQGFRDEKGVHCFLGHALPGNLNSSSLVMNTNYNVQ